MDTATVSWTDPTENTDGSPLTDLVGYIVEYGQDPDNLTEYIYIEEEGDPTTSVTINDLTEGIWYFTVTALTSEGVESDPSAIGSKIIYPEKIIRRIGMVNYKEIADAIPQAESDACMVELNKEYTYIDRQGQAAMGNGKFMDDITVQAAFDAIKDLTTLTVPSKVLVTYKGIAQLSGFDVADKLQTNILSAIADNKLAQWVDDAFNSEGINVKDSKFRSKIASLSGAHGFTTAFINQMKTIGDVESLNFSGLKPGHVQNAMQKRHAGVI